MAPNLEPRQRNSAETVLTHACATCGMVLDDPGEFHPYLFCVLKEAGRDPWSDFKWAVEQLGFDLPDEAPLVKDRQRHSDLHDDHVEAQLLDRLERDSLLRDGMTATDARSSLDA